MPRYVCCGIRTIRRGRFKRFREHGFRHHEWLRSRLRESHRNRSAAAVGVALLVHHHHAATRSEAFVIGCTPSSLGGISLKNESGNQTYMILSKGTPSEAEERVELKGVVANRGSGNQAFGVHVFEILHQFFGGAGGCGWGGCSLDGGTMFFRRM